ncbi:arylesterase [Novosphingobium sp. 9]|uniref:arylesterase n=1 Tax=Novosphingobium sp. 9 TaxID=2025349 RepID=UPI0021B6E195|nr:arylesterase [Novosphingobium sp. 9]
MRPILMTMAAACVLALAGCGGGASDTPAEAPSSMAASDAAPDLPVIGAEQSVLAFGDSLLAGYGLASDEAYPHRLELALRARGINARIANAGVSGNTTADGLARLDFTLKSQSRKPDLVLISLGGNDLLRALPPEQAKDNLGKILARLEAEHIRVVLLGLKAPPNLGPDYVKAFDAIFPELARQYHATLVPFFLAPIYNHFELQLADHIHPTANGVDAMVAMTVDTVVKALPKSAQPDSAGATVPAPPNPH